MNKKKLSVMLGLEECKGSALRIGQHGHASDIFNRHGRHLELCTEILGLCGNRIAIGYLQVDLPVRRRGGIAKRGRENSCNELVLAEEVVVVVRRVFVFFADAPSKKLLVETARGILIGSAEVSDAKGSWNPLNTEPALAFRLPHGKNCSGGVLQDSHSSHVEDIEGRGKNFRA